MIHISHSTDDENEPGFNDVSDVHIHTEATFDKMQNGDNPYSP